MTQNQLTWLAQQEQARANRAKEEETRRSNLAVEAERQRSNLRNELIAMYQSETARRKQEREAEHMEIEEVRSAVDAGFNIGRLIGGLIVGGM